MGTCGMGGPPLVLWSMSHNWSNQRTRAFLYSVFGPTIPLQLALLYVIFGSDVGLGLLVGAMLLPAVFLGAFIGLHIGNRLSKPLLKTVAYIMLIAIALNSILPQLVNWLRG